MGKFSATVALRCSARQAFAFLNDQHNFVGLNEHNFRNYRVVSLQSVGAGAQSEFVLKTGAFQEMVHLQVVTSETPSLLVEEGYLGDNPFRNSWKLKPLSFDQSELELITEYELSGPAVLFSGKIQEAFVRIYTRLLTEIARKLNTSS